MQGTAALAIVRFSDNSSFNLICPCYKKSEYEQEMPSLHITDQPTAQLRRDKNTETLITRCVLELDTLILA